MTKPSRGVAAIGSLTAEPVAPGASPASNADGTALRSAVGAWLVGVDPAICAVVPADFPTDLLSLLDREGIDVSRVRQTASIHAGEEADPSPSPEQLASLSPSWSVHVCGMAPWLQQELVRAVSQRVAVVTLDSSVALPLRPDPEQVIAVAIHCDAFLPSREDITYLWPGRPPRDVLRLLLRRGIRAAVIKLGSGGSIGIREGKIVWVPAFPITGRRGLGGGDAYAGAFSAVYALERDLGWSMVWATAAASVVVETASPMDAMTVFARNRVAYRARLLQDDLRRG